MNVHTNNDPYCLKKNLINLSKILGYLKNQIKKIESGCLLHI